MPSAFFVLGFLGTSHNEIPDSWLSEFRCGVTVLGKLEYSQHLSMPLNIKITEALDYKQGFEVAIDQLSEREGPVLILASGDPGFFGPVRHLKTRFPNVTIHVCPTASAVATAFARLGENWDDAVVISSLGSRNSSAQTAIKAHLRLNTSKIAVMCSDETGAEVIRSLVGEIGKKNYRIDFFADLGSHAERHWRYENPDRVELAHNLTSSFCIAIIRAKIHDHESATVVARHNNLGSKQGAGTPSPAPTKYQARESMYTKPEVRAIIISKIAPWNLAFGSTVWDVGAGSGSVGLELLGIRPDLDLISIDVDGAACELISSNSLATGRQLEIVHSNICQVAKHLREPSAVFVGGGGIRALEVVLDAVGPSIQVVASSATMENAQSFRQLLGEQVLVQIYRSVALGSAGNRLDGYNPVFISYRSHTQSHD